MNVSAPLCAPTADARFGPAVNSACRDGFDFTLAFEQSILVILPASLLLIAAPIRLFGLRKARAHVNNTSIRVLKLVVTSCLAVLQLVLVGLWAARGSPSQHLNSICVTAACISFASSLMSCVLSYAEHVKSPRPSSILNAFLLVSLLLDCALVRTLWLSPPTIDGSIRGIFTAAFATKAILLFLEAKPKTKHLLHQRAFDYSPEATAGLYARAVLAWVTPVLRIGFKRLLLPTDMFTLDEDMRSGTLHEKFRYYWSQQSSGNITSEYHLLFTCITTLRWPLLAVVLPRMVLLAFTICQPLVLNRFLDFLKDDSQSANIGYGLVGAYGLVYLGIAVSQALYWHRNARSVSMLRGVLVTSVFSKLTELSAAVASDAAAVTLMSSDVDVIVRAAKEVHELWANVIQIAIGTWLLSTQIGYAAAGPIIISLLALCCTVFVSPKAKAFRVAWLKKTQERVAITSATIGHIKSIKMSGLSKSLANTISTLRVNEIVASRPFRVIGALTSSIAQIPILISPVLAFAMFQGVANESGETLDATRLFAALALIILQAQPLFFMFETILDLSAAAGALDRIQKFLLMPTKKGHRASTGHARKLTVASRGTIELQSLTRLAMTPGQTSDNGSDTAIEVHDAEFAWTKDKVDLHNVHFSLKRGQLAMVVGPVASGKSTLLKGLLGEVPNVSGRVWLASTQTAWCEQSPWIVNQSIRDNIIGYSRLDENLYLQVIRACSLQEDFDQLPHGDLTTVGSKGLGLSGGQKQRVALARAIYCRPSIAIFDDIFSGLDNHTAARVFGNLFGSNGLLREWNTTSVLATQTVNFLSSADLIVALSSQGKVVEVDSFANLSNAGGYTQSLIKENTDVTISESRELATKTTEAKDPKRPSEPKGRGDIDDKRRQLGDATVYKYYFGSIGSGFLISLLVLEVVWAFLQSFPSIWLNFWADKNGKQAGYYLGIYATMQVVGVLWFALLIWFVLVQIAAKSGITLHQRLLHTVLQAPLSVLVATDLGSLATRFSQDIGMVDNQLPLALVVTLASFFTVFARAALLASSSYYVAISFPFLGILYFYLQRCYLRTSRQLRFLDLEEKAPVYTQFLETLSGLPTIRAMGWGSATVQKNHDLVDKSQKPFYLLIMIQRWLVLVLDLITTGLALLVVGFAVYLRGTVSVGLTGVSLVQLISMSETLNTLIQFWTSIETSIGAVARIKQFAEATGEENLPGENQEPPQTWPSAGHIVFSDLSASYGENSELRALDAVNMEIKPGEKIAICGRTGSGKSSLFLIMLRLLDSTNGSITIDSLPLASIPRETIRTRLIAISQEQFVLPGSIRQNIDPSGVCDTEDIENALCAVGLWAAIEAKGGLETILKEDLLSHGQKQLFFLARAVLKKHVGNIVLLDEATSSVDSETENNVRRVIENQFRDHTVISIAHRLDMIVDYDKVFVLEQGKVVEVGRPRELLRSEGRFKALWEASLYVPV